MKKYSFTLLMLSVLPWMGLSGQNSNNTAGGGNNSQNVSLKNDTVLNFVLDQDYKLMPPGSTTEYSISSYKNIDFLKTDPFKLVSPGMHSEIYISNTHHGVIIISSAEPNTKLRDYNMILQVNPDFYETYSRRDTLVISPDKYNKPVFDFTRASALRQDYKNAYNYSVDPRTGISWSKTNEKDIFKTDWGLGRELYDLIIVMPKILAK